MTESTLSTVYDIRNYIFAGKAEFTLKSNVTGKHFTYRVVKSSWYPDPEARVVYYLSGSDNENDFAYLGILNKYKRDSDSLTMMRVRHTDNSPDERSPVFSAIAWFCRTMNCTKIPDNVEFMHSGKCSACGRKLTTPESIQTGMGKICAEKFRNDV